MYNFVSRGTDTYVRVIFILAVLAIFSASVVMMVLLNNETVNKSYSGYVLAILTYLVFMYYVPVKNYRKHRVSDRDGEKKYKRFATISAWVSFKLWGLLTIIYFNIY